MGCSNDHPSPLITWFIFGKHSSAVFTENRSTEAIIFETNTLGPLELQLLLIHL